MLDCLTMRRLNPSRLGGPAPRASIRFIEADWAALDTLAAERGQSRSELIREAIAVGVATLKEAPPQAS